MANNTGSETLPEKENDIVDFRINVAIYKTRLNNKYKSRKPYEAPNPKKIRSFMPGTIMDVMCEPGQEVEPETKLCVLEAMKMKNIIFPSIKGKVKQVLVKPGQLVPKNHVLVELE